MENNDNEWEMEWEDDLWAWEGDLPVPIYQTWWYDLTAEG